MATILQIMNADCGISLFSRALKIADFENKLNEIGPFTRPGLDKTYAAAEVE